MIHLEHVSKVYASANGPVRALDDVSLSVPEGRFVAVRGPSGCGKSTLLTLCGGLAQPTAGKVRVAGEDLAAMSASARAAFRGRQIGFVFQMFHLLPYLNVVDNVLVAGDGQAAAKRARELLERCGMAHRLTHRPEALSVGERQRVAIARALLNGPRLLLADEPTGNLDPANADGVMQLLADFHRDGGTVLLVTHDRGAADRAERTLSLRDGRLETEAVSSAAE